MKLSHHIGALLFVIGMLIFTVFIVQEYLQSRPFPTFDSVLVSSTQQEHSKKPFTFSTWIDPANEKQALETISTASGLIEVLIPTWYQLTKTGEFVSIPSNNKDDIIQISKEASIKILPAITDNADASTSSKLLTSTSIQRDAIEMLSKTAVEKSYGGYVIDFTQISPEHGEDFTAFLKKLDEALQKNNKQLAITVPAKSQKGKDTPQTAAYDWISLGQIVDRIYIRIDPPTLHQAGIIETNNLLDDILAYAVTTIPDDKIGVLFAIDGIELQGKRVSTLSYSSINKLIASRSIYPQRDLETSLLQASYGAGSTQTIFLYEDAVSIMKKISTLQSFSIRHVSFTPIGGEDMNIWKTLQKL